MSLTLPLLIVYLNLQQSSRLYYYSLASVSKRYVYPQQVHVYVPLLAAFSKVYLQQLYVLGAYLILLKSININVVKRSILPWIYYQGDQLSSSQNSSISTSFLFSQYSRSISCSKIVLGTIYLGKVRLIYYQIVHASFSAFYYLRIYVPILNLTFSNY